MQSFISLGQQRALSTFILLASLLSACGGGGGGSAPTITPPAAPSASLSVTMKQLNFAWSPVAGASSYRLMRNADGVSGFTQAGGDINGAATNTSLDIPVHLTDWVNARYQIHACNAAGCTTSADLTAMSGFQTAAGFFKASNTATNDVFGARVAISGDGSTLAVGATLEDSNAVGVNGDDSNNSAASSGAVYVFARINGLWQQQAYVKASNVNVGDAFGTSLALSDDGNTLAVGATGEDGFATGINGNQLDNTAENAGATYVFTRSGQAWSQQAYLKASNTEAQDHFGYQVALSSDGNTLVVTADDEDSSANGIDGNQATNLASGAGAAYVFNRANGTWSQSAYVKSSNSGAGHTFGTSLALSGDGHTFVVGATGEGSGVSGVNGNQANNNAPDSGAAYVFTLDGGAWTQQAYLKSSNTNADLHFALSLAIDSNGNTVAVGAHYEDSNATGIDGDQSDVSAVNSGAVYVFVRTAGIWQQQSYLKASNTDGYDLFGVAVTLSDDGNILAVGAPYEDSLTAGMNGNQLDNTGDSVGAVYVFSRSNAEWSQRSYVKANAVDFDDRFGRALALSGDGNSLVVGFEDDSTATGIGGDANNNSSTNSGGVYLY